MNSQDRVPQTADVSVIVPAYQAEETIARALDSALAQTVLPAEIIVIDDGSRDRTREIVSEYVSKAGTCAVRLLEQENLGAGAARNQGLMSATRETVAFLDADDEWLPEKLERSLAVLAEIGADFVSHDLLRMEGGVTDYVSCAQHFSRRSDPLPDYFLRGYISTSTVVARRDILLRAGGFDPSLRSGQDYELWLAVISSAETKHHVFDEALMKYHVTPNSITSQVELRRRASMRILRRHLPALRGRTRRPRIVGMMRAAIICVQAASAHRRAGNFLGAVAAVARLPIHVVSIMTLKIDGAVERPSFVSSGAVIETRDKGEPWQGNALRSDPVNPFLSTREQAEDETSIGQQRNRLWWEKKPMTYADWEAEERLPATPLELAEIEKQILGESPFMRDELDWTQFHGLDVLDIGCGSGALATRIAKHGAHVTAIDLTQTAVDLTKQNAAQQGLDLEVIRCDVEKLPIRADTFDFVFSWGVLHHTETFENALNEVHRVLKPGGRSLIMVYYRNSVVYYLHGLFWLIAKGYLFRGYTIHSVQDLYTDGYFHRYFSTREMKECIEAAGLKPTGFSVTQYQKKILPGIPTRLDTYMKRRFGMCLVAEFEKPLSS